MALLFRLAKASDAKRLAEIHSKIKDVNRLGIFVLMGGAFLRKYYNLVLSDKYSVCVCAEDESGLVVGYSFALLDSKKHHEHLMKHKLGLAFAALNTLIAKPYLIKELYRRYVSLKSNDGTYATEEGVRGGYWGWDPDCKDACGAIETEEHQNAVLKGLGVKDLHFEVDVDNKQIYKYHLKRGAFIDKEVTLPDGRKRALMHINIENYKFYILKQFNN